jgi:hypothetical protein
MKYAFIFLTVAFAAFFPRRRFSGANQFTIHTRLTSQ